MSRQIWFKARKKPVEVRYREVIPNSKDENGAPVEIIKTREGKLLGYLGIDYVIKGIKGEIYPIEKDIFDKTYEKIEKKKKTSWRD